MRPYVWLTLCLLTAWADPVRADDPNQPLQGSYAFSSTDGCLVSLTGFTANQTAQSPAFVTTDSQSGIFTFNGDGTGTRQGITQTISHPSAVVTRATMSSNTFVAPFTYEVAADRTVTLQSSGPFTATFLTGPQVGQTVTVDSIPLQGRISQDGKTITIASSEPPQMEALQFFDGDVLLRTQVRFCHRADILVRMPDQGEGG